MDGTHKTLFNAILELNGIIYVDIIEAKNLVGNFTISIGDMSMWVKRVKSIII